MHPILYNSTFHVKGGAGRADVVDYDGSTNAGQRQAVCDALNIYIYVKRKATQPASVQRIFSRGCTQHDSKHADVNNRAVATP